MIVASDRLEALVASSSSSAPSPLILGLIGLVVICVVTWGVLRGPWTAWYGESEEITGAVAVHRDGELYITVSGHAELLSSRGGNRGVRSDDYPRLTTWRASDGEQVARRQYAPVFFRFSYVDTVVRALTAGDGQVWVVSTDRTQSLHAVDPVTLADTLDHEALVGRLPALKPGLFMDNVGAESPVLLYKSDLVFRLTSGPWMALDPLQVAAREVGPEVVYDVTHPGRPPGSEVVDKLVRHQRSDLLEPVVLPVYDAHGVEDVSVSYVVTQTSLERETAGVRITRFDLDGGAPVEGWVATPPDVHPACCQWKVWRTGGAAIVWYEDWLIALDDTSGAVRWMRRL